MSKECAGVRSFPRFVPFHRVDTLWWVIWGPYGRCGWAASAPAAPVPSPGSIDGCLMATMKPVEENLLSPQWLWLENKKIREIVIQQQQLFRSLVNILRFSTWRPEMFCKGTLWAIWHPIPQRARFRWKVSDPQHGGQRLQSVFRVSTVLLRLLVIRLRPSSEADLRWSEWMGPFSPDEERARHLRIWQGG